MAGRTVYAVHWHQKQRNADRADDLILAPEGYFEAVYDFLKIAEDHGILPEEHGCYSYEDVDRISELDVGPFVLKLLRSNEMHPSGVEHTDEPEQDGDLQFVLDNPIAANVEDRTVRLVELRYSADQDGLHEELTEANLGHVKEKPKAAPGGVEAATNTPIGIERVVGKTIAGVAVAQGGRGQGRVQVFLIFNDGTHFEIWGEDVHLAGGVDKGGMEKVLSYIERMGSHIEHRYPEPSEE